jgi:hypothetical protein
MSSVNTFAYTRCTSEKPASRRHCFCGDEFWNAREGGWGSSIAGETISLTPTKWSWEGQTGMVTVISAWSSAFDAPMVAKSSAWIRWTLASGAFHVYRGHLLDRFNELLGRCGVKSLRSLSVFRDYYVFGEWNLGVWQVGRGQSDSVDLTSNPSSG